jgi:2-methylisocitrate lyase-like PEP mutase family enzyme
VTDRRERFRALHVPGDPLVLVNAWDVGTALTVQACGLPAVATTSAGISWSHGVADGANLTRDEALAAIARIVERVDVPVSADVEDGYGTTEQEVADTVAAAAALGVAGINIEDAAHHGPAPLRPIGDQTARIAAARAAAGAEVFINARIDTVLAGRTDPDETLRRADAYLEAGADGIFVPGITDPSTVAALVDQIEAPVNIMVDLGGPSIEALASVGVARISLGASLAVAALQALCQTIHDITPATTSLGHTGGPDWLHRVLG